MNVQRVVLSLCAALGFGLLSCGAPPSASDAGDDDAGTTLTDAGMDALAGTWTLSGTVSFGANPYQLVGPLTLTRASDGNYRALMSGCTIPFEQVSTTTLRSVETTCSFTQADLTQVTLNGFTPGFGDSVTMRFSGGGEVRLVADVFSANGGVVDLHFPNVPGTWSFSGARR